MLSFNVLIGFHKIPELFLAFLSQKLTDKKKKPSVSVSKAENVQIKIYSFQFAFQSQKISQRTQNLTL